MRNKTKCILIVFTVTIYLLISGFAIKLLIDYPYGKVFPEITDLKLINQSLAKQIALSK
jgi:hypothetical protein